MIGYIVKSSTAFLLSLGIAMLIDYMFGQILYASIVVGIVVGLFLISPRLSLVIAVISISTVYIGWNIYYLQYPWGMETLMIFSDIVGFQPIMVFIIPILILSLISGMIASGLATLVQAKRGVE